MRARIVCLPGDGVGPEVMEVAVRVLTSVACAFSHSFIFVKDKLGGASLTASGIPLTQSTAENCRGADAVLLGTVGGPRWQTVPREKRPEYGLKQLLDALDLYADVRFLKVPPAFCPLSPLRPGLIGGADILMVQEACTVAEPGWEGDTAWDTLSLTAEKAERLAQLAFRLAAERRGQVCLAETPESKATGKLLREAVSKAARENPGVTARQLPSERCVAELMRDPGQFDVLLLSPISGSVLCGAAAALMGGPGVMPATYLGDHGPEVYRPVHGSEPELEGRDLADPIAMILCAALMLRRSFNLHNEADCLETAVANVLEAGWRTADLVSGASPRVGTEAIGKLIAEQVDMVGAVMGSFHR